MKVDLDELERKARAATNGANRGPWRVYRCHYAGDAEACGIKDEPFESESDDACQRGVVYDASRDECHHVMWRQDAEHIAANAPDVTLALVARIRELEAAIETRVGTRDGVLGACDCGSCVELRALVAKGVVLP